MLYAFMEKFLSQLLLWHVVQPSINSTSLHAFGEVTSLATQILLLNSLHLDV